MSKQLLHIEKLSVGYSQNQQVLKDVTASIKGNQLILLIGDNGTGKSTLLKTICGLLPPLAGSVKLYDQEIQQWNAKQLAQKIAFVSSNLSLSHLMTIREFIFFGRYPYSNWLAKRTKEDEQQVERAIEVCGLSHLAHKQINEISDGEKQKVVIARAFAQQTAITILDEPTTHLDIKNSNSIFKLLKQQKEEGERTIIFSSHQVEKALKIADIIWLLIDGYLHETTPEEFNQNKKLKEAVFGKEAF